MDAHGVATHGHEPGAAAEVTVHVLPRRNRIPQECLGLVQRLPDRVSEANDVGCGAGVCSALNSRSSISEELELVEKGVASLTTQGRSEQLPLRVHDSLLQALACARTIGSSPSASGKASARETLEEDTCPQALPTSNACVSLGGLASRSRPVSQ